MLRDFYDHLPYELKKFAASTAGAYRQRLRYDRYLEERVSAAIERETWTTDQWMSYVAEKISKVLSIACNEVPFYQDQWTKRRISGDKSSPEYLENWPILDKQSVLQHPKAFLRHGVNPIRMHIDHTSGTSGTPLTIFQSTETIRTWYALFEARWRRWYGVSVSDRWAIFGGQLIVPAKAYKPPFWVWNGGMRQLYCSSYHISQQTAEYYLIAITRYEVNYILGYASSLYSLAKFGLELGLTPPNIKLVLNNAEPLLEHQREILKSFFKCEVRDTYGMSEMLCAGSECNFGHLHLWPETGVQEVDPLVGLISTGFINMDMPLIRYAVGDEISLNTQISCSCGRTMPLIESIQGRIDDMVLTKDGRRIGRLDPVFKSNLRIIEAQIIQEEPDRFVVKVVPSSGYDDFDRNKILDELFKRVGDVKATVESVDSIPRTKAGKFKAVISKVNKHDRH